jgi:hypothetical protein
MLVSIRAWELATRACAAVVEIARGQQKAPKRHDPCPCASFLVVVELPAPPVAAAAGPGWEANTRSDGGMLLSRRPQAVDGDKACVTAVISSDSWPRVLIA